MIRFEGVKKVYPGNGKTPDILALNDVICTSGKVNLCLCSVTRARANPPF